MTFVKIRFCQNSLVVSSYSLSVVFEKFSVSPVLSLIVQRSFEVVGHNNVANSFPERYEICCFRLLSVVVF